MASEQTVSLSRQQFDDLMSRAARAEKMLLELQGQVDYLESESGAKPAAGSISVQDLKKLIVSTLEQQDVIISTEFAEAHGIDPEVLVGAQKSLEAFEVIIVERTTEERMILSEEGQAIVNAGVSPETALFNKIPAEGINMKDLKDLAGANFKFAFPPLKKAKVVSIDKKTKMLMKSVDTMEDVLLNQLLTIQQNGAVSKKDIKVLKRRNLMGFKSFSIYTLRKGPKFGEDINVLTAVTYETAVKHTDKNGNWTGPAIKKMNLTALPPQISHGALHPLMKVRSEFRNILLFMGFEEMSTNRYVESCFWNFDALFQPQAHPARDAHDTFFLNKPATAPIPDPFADYFDRVRQTHENGWETGSLGWRTPWKESEAEKNILRTHTTAISSRTLYEIAQQPLLKPRKFFSIDRVFRNESVDATHLAEFHQVEGFIIGPNLTLGHLIGIIAEFFQRIGIPDVRFKPAYNPYTEPSMEIFGKKPGTDKWLEVGNSGVFRPEMLLPMGLPPNVNVIAWGLGLERPTMIKYGIRKIKDLFGHEVDLAGVQNNPICRFDQ